MSDWPPPASRLQPAPPAPPSLQWRPLAGPLAAQQLGSPDAPRVVFVHGFTQTGNSWKPIAERFVALGYQAVVVDLPGHGGSTHVRSDLRRTADGIAAAGGVATYIGYSLGGRACLHLALMYPHLVASLVLIGAHPGIADADERARRREADDQLAARMQEIGLEAFLKEWTALPLFGGFVPGPDDIADRLHNTEDGLASSLRMAGTGEQGSLWPRLMELNMPVLAIAGADDAKFIAIAQQIAEAVPEGECRIVAGAAHAAHLQQPEAVAAAITTALRPRPDELG
ncbi:MAG: alpha/beta fold hydrolase [Actinomycetota bacterium]|nr:alpha/beta fold hydrolase [Actinomycetota bacterium]